MKKVFLIVAVLAFAFSVQSQKITKQFLVGKWVSKESEIEFSVGKNRELNIVSYSYVSGNYFKIIGYQFNKGNFYLQTLHESNNWEAIGKYFLIDENTMVVDYVSKAPGQTIYKRVINNN
jgi:hypothetical protein